MRRSGDWRRVAVFHGFWPQLSRFKLVLAIACVGRMALTNYLLQTLICTTLFYPHSGSFSTHFDRLELLAFVIPVWLANILFSVIWLRYFRQGPGGQWLWRQLTLRAAGLAVYLKHQDNDLDHIVKQNGCNRFHCCDSIHEVLYSVLTKEPPASSHLLQSHNR